MMQKLFSFGVGFFILSCLMIFSCGVQDAGYQPSSRSPAQNYYSPNYPTAYPQYRRLPYSRGYRNPYEFPNSRGGYDYYQHSDYDNYYVPPSNYQGNGDSDNHVDPNMKL